MVSYNSFYKKERELDTQRCLTSPQPKPVNISVIIPVYNPPMEAFEKCLLSVTNQIFTAHEIILVDDCSTDEQVIKFLEKAKALDRVQVVKTNKNSHISGASNLGAQHASGEFLFFLDNDDEIPPNALFDIAQAIQENPETDYLYGDENKISADGSFCEPYFKPDWSPEHITSVMYALHPLFIRANLFKSLGGFSKDLSGAQDYDLCLRASLKARKVTHVRRIIYHWRKINGSAADKVDAKPYALERARRAVENHFKDRHIHCVVENGLIYGTFRPRPILNPPPKVSILILTDCRTRQLEGRGDVNLIENCIKSIREKTTYSNVELVVIHNQNMPEDTKKMLHQHGVDIFGYTSPHDRFNLPHKFNSSLKYVSGEYLVFLNDDTEVISPDWIESMLDYASLPNVGTVGARLIFANETVEHAGVVFDRSGYPIHVNYKWAKNDPGHCGFALVARNYLTLTGACIMAKMSTWRKYNGLDEAYNVDYNDTDFCLRLAADGLRHVYTPFAQLYHFHQSTFSGRVQSSQERDLFMSRWGQIVTNDPYFNAPKGAISDIVNPY